MSLHAVGEKSAELGAEKIVIIDRWKSGFGGFRFFKVNGRITQVPPCMYILSVKLQREFGVPRKRGRLLVFDGTCVRNPEAERLKESLSNFFALRVMNIKEAPPEYRTAMRLEAYSPRGVRLSFYLLPENVEIGPRITISHVEWKI